MRSTKFLKTFAVLVYGHLHDMVILRSQNKIIDFFIILAWVWTLNIFIYRILQHSITLMNMLHSKDKINKINIEQNSMTVSTQ